MHKHCLRYETNETRHPTTKNAKRTPTNIILLSHVTNWRFVTDFRCNIRMVSVLNQAAVDALCSATYLEHYLDCVDDLPSDVQRIVSMLRELDCLANGKLR